jgi:hypothetical protein
LTLLRCRKPVRAFDVSPGNEPAIVAVPRENAHFPGFFRISPPAQALQKAWREQTEATMTLTITPSITIRIRRAADNARHVIRTHTRHLSITSLSFLRLEVLVFRYHGK